MSKVMTRDMMAEMCCKHIDHEIENGILCDPVDAIHFAIGYFRRDSDSVPFEVLEHIGKVFE